VNVLQTIDLKKQYGSEPNITRALDGVNLSVEQGEFVAVVGTSGSGKSTLLNMMGGLDTTTSGSVEISAAVSFRLVRSIGRNSTAALTNASPASVKNAYFRTCMEHFFLPGQIRTKRLSPKRGNRLI